VTLPDNNHLPPEEAPPDERLDRQVRIPGWNQEALARARVGVVGDDPWLTGLFVTSAAALGINRLTVVAPELDERLLSAARGLNPELNLAFFPGYFSHPLLEELLQGCAVLVDLGGHALATKLLLNQAHRQGLPLVRGYNFAEDGAAGFRLFTYLKGREWRGLFDVLPGTQLPSSYPGDPVLALVTAGLVLEETKKLLLGEPVTPEVISYIRPSPAEGAPPPPSPLPPPGGEGEENALRFSRSAGEPDAPATLPTAPKTENRKQKTDTSIVVVGAGALGNFVALGLASLGFTRLTFIDPDPVEVTNLNRQILFWDAVGQPKAAALARRIAAWFGVAARVETSYVDRDFDLSDYAVVFDGTDNFESRILLSERCRENGQILISGGTGVAAGQVVVFNPAHGGPTPAELLGLYDIVGQRQLDVQERQRASCVYAPEPAVIMTNQIIGGLMVDALRRLLAGEPSPNLFYDARGEKMLS
jgi:molybdopterin/thiamine biosynthesis adenylyltransferase